MRNWLRLLVIGLLVVAATGGPIRAQGETPATPTTTEATTPAAATAEPKPEEKKPPTTEERLAAIEKTQSNITVNLDTVWVMIGGMLVFFMNMGFACVESGMCRAKNCVNILAKNFVVFAVSTLAFWAVGWGLMFGTGDGGFYGTEGLFFVGGADGSPAMGDAYAGAYSSIKWAGVPLWAKFFFQLVFAGTAATIVSGAVAERIKYHAFIVFTFILGVAIYPITGHWIWGNGWLQANIKFFDFAGSTAVHCVGGWAALTGAIILGPRLGKYTADGKPKAIPGHNMTAATIGCLVLWFGWFGFNPGSTMAANGELIAHCAVTTNTAGAIATLTATITAWVLLGKPDIGMTLNGCLAGLVAITAGCAVVSVEMSAVIGAIAGVLVVVGVIGFDRIGVDDPVGATSVHLLNGAFGTLCVGLFANQKAISLAAAVCDEGLFISGSPTQLIRQSIGIGAVGVYVLAVSAAAWLLLKYTMGIRVSAAEETEGLDLGEHGNEAYHGFVIQEG